MNNEISQIGTQNCLTDDEWLNNSASPYLTGQSIDSFKTSDLRVCPSKSREFELIGNAQILKGSLFKKTTNLAHYYRKKGTKYVSDFEHSDNQNNHMKIQEFNNDFDIEHLGIQELHKYQNNQQQKQFDLFQFKEFHNIKDTSQRELVLLETNPFVQKFLVAQIMSFGSIVAEDDEAPQNPVEVKTKKTRSKRIKRIEEPLKNQESDEEKYIGPHNKNYSLWPQNSQKEHIQKLWKKLAIKAQGSVKMVHYLEQIRTKIDLFGQAPQIIKKKQTQQDKMSVIFRDKILIMPSSQYLLIWELVVILTLLYIGTLGIYVQTFIDDTHNIWLNDANSYITHISDFIFSIDIILNFITAYHREDFRLETRFRFISMNYLFGGMFMVDLISAIPFEQLMISSGEDQQFASVRMIKLLRLFKLLKLSKYNNKFKYIRTKSIDVRMVISTIILFLMAHISACLLYQYAKVNEFNQMTWVYHIQSEQQYQYLGEVKRGGYKIYTLCLLWTMQSLLGIGYGHLNKFMNSNIEISIAVVLMLVSQFMMSLQIGLIINIIEKNLNKNDSSDGIQSSIIRLFHANSQINKAFRLQNRFFLQIAQAYKVQMHTEQNENLEKLILQLPAGLQNEIEFLQRNTFHIRFHFLQNFDENLLSQIIYNLKIVFFAQGHCVYKKGQRSNCLYLVQFGRVETKNGVKSRYQHFGELEVFHELINKQPTPRMNDALVLSEMCELYKIDNCILQYILIDYPLTKKYLIQQALQNHDNSVHFMNEQIKEHPLEVIDRVEELYSMALIHIIKCRQREKLDFTLALQQEDYAIKEDFIEQMSTHGQNQMNKLTCDILETFEDQQGIYQKLEDFNEDMGILAANSIKLTQLLQLVYLENEAHVQFFQALNQVSDEVSQEMKQTCKLIDQIL